MRYNEIIESLDDDDDLFGDQSRNGKAIAHDLSLWLRRRQSGSRRPLDSSSAEYVQAVIAGFNRSFLHGLKVWSTYQLYNTDIRWDLRNYIEDQHGVDLADNPDDVFRGIDESEDDNELFGKSSELANQHKEKIKQIMDPYLRTVRKIRELAKTRYGAKIRVSSVPKSSARGRATVWVGDYDANYQIPKTTPEAFRVKEDLEQLGFECRFTDAGWLSVKVPPAFSDLINEEDDDLFGDRGGNWVQAIAQTMHKLVHEASHYMKISDPVGDVRTRTDMRIAMQDCKLLAQALRTDGVTGFLNALNDVSRDTVDRIDAGLAMDHGVYLSDIEKGFGHHDDLDESDDEDIFGRVDDAVLAYRLMLRLRQAVSRNPRGLQQALAQHPDADRRERERIAFAFMADQLQMSREQMDNLATELHMLPLKYSEPDWFVDYWNARKLNHFIKKMAHWLKSWNLAESEDDELFGDRRHAILARFFREFADYHAETARTLKRKYDRDVYRTLNLDYREIASAFEKSLEKGLARWRVLGVHNRDSSAREVKERLGIDIYSLAYPRVRRVSEDAEADDDLFGTNTLADRIKALLKHKQRVRIAVSGAMGWVRGMRDNDVIIARSPRSTTRYLWPGLHTERAKNFELAQDPSTGVWVVTDRADFD